MDPRFSLNVRPHSMGETRFFLLCFFGKPFKKNGFESPFCGPAFFAQRASPLDGRDSFFCYVLLENHLKKTVWSRHLFLFYFKGEKQNKK